MSDEASTKTLRLGTRGSLLARMQSQSVADDLQNRHRGLKVELVICKTTGDVITGKPLHEAGGKGLFTKELEEALLAGTIDLAVHSFKDMPVTLPLVDQADLIVAATPPREDVRDVLVSGKAQTIDQLPHGARVGTGSLRRRCQLLAQRPDLEVQLVRGNIDTRVRKLREGQFDAVVLALAGIRRSGLFDEKDMTPIPLDQMLPAAAQGALAIQCRRSHESTRRMIFALDDLPTHRCVDLERELVLALNGDCHSPIAALASIGGGKTQLRAVIGSRGGNLPVIRAQGHTLSEVITELERQNVRRMLADGQG